MFFYEYPWIIHLILYVFKIPYAVLSSVLVSIQNISEDTILNFPPNKNIRQDVPDTSTKTLKTNDDENHNSTHSQEFVKVANTCGIAYREMQQRTKDNNNRKLSYLKLNELTVP